MDGGFGNLATDGSSSESSDTSSDEVLVSAIGGHFEGLGHLSTRGPGSNSLDTGTSGTEASHEDYDDISRSRPQIASPTRTQVPPSESSNISAAQQGITSQHTGSYYTITRGNHCARECG